MDLEAFLKDILTPMLDHPDDFRVDVRADGRKYDARIHAAVPDRGRIIGKSGRMISSLRTLARAAGEKEGLHVSLELHEEPGESLQPRD